MVSRTGTMWRRPIAPMWDVIPLNIRLCQLDTPSCSDTSSEDYIEEIESFVYDSVDEYGYICEDLYHF